GDGRDRRCARTIGRCRAGPRSRIVEAASVSRGDRARVPTGRGRMDSVIVSDFGVSLGKTSERLVVRGPRPRLELMDGGPQLLLPIDLVARPPLHLVTSNGVRQPEETQRRANAGKPRATQPKPDQIELPLFRIGEI